MIINGREFNFNRIVKVELVEAGSGNPVYSIEFNPLKKRELCARIEADILGLPKVTKTDSPSYSAKVIIYNPEKVLLALVAKNINFLLGEDVSNKDINLQPTLKNWRIPMVLPDSLEDKVIYATNRDEDASQIIQQQVSETLTNFYKRRPKIRLYAGYYDQETEHENYSLLFEGYLNGSSFHHRGTEDMLQLNCHDLDLSEIPGGTILTSVSKARRAEIENSIIMDNDKRRRGKETFDASLRNYESWFATERIRVSDGKLVKLTQGALDSMWRSDYFKKNNPTSDINVWYVTSKQAVLKGLKNQEEYNNAASWKNKDLEYLLTHSYKENRTSPNLLGFYTPKVNLREILNDLCAATRIPLKNGETVPIGWDVINENVSKTTYIIFPIGNGPTTTSASSATYRIWNYQNLLESPAVDGAGCLTIRMLLKPEIRSGESIALMLSEDLGEQEGLVNVSSFTSSIMYGKSRMLGSLATSANLTTTPSIQLSEAASVAALNKKKESAEQDGYMFNRGFYIQKFEHKISTHTADWSTMVKTVPMYGGVKA